MILRLPAALAAIASIAVWLSHTPATAAESLADLDSYRAGCQSLRDGRYETAASQFLETWNLLQQGAGGDLEREFVTSRLLESLVRNGDTKQAAEWLERHPLISPSAKTLQWAGIAFYEEERYTEAADTFGALIGSYETDDRDLIRRYLFSLALSGSADDAITSARAIFTPENYNESLDLARIAVMAGRPSQALKTLGVASHPKTLTFEEQLKSTRIMVAALTQLNRKAEAAKLARDLILLAETQRENLTGFLLLEATEPDISDNETKKWISALADNENYQHSDMAAFFTQALFATDSELMPYLESIAKDLEHPLQNEAALRLKLQQIDTESLSRTDSNNLLLSEPERSLFATASLAYQQENFKEAAQLFLKEIQSKTGSARSRAAFNAAISSLQADDLEAFEIASEELESHNPRSPFIADLSYLGGLYQAAKGAPGAFVNLQNFIRDHPLHPSTVDARLALSEIHLNQVPARPQAAREVFSELKTQPLTLVQNERLDYTAIWVELIDNNAPRLTELAEAFVTDWPNSNYLPQVAMLLGMEYLKSNNLEEAREKFDLIAEQFPNSPYADTAKFFAAKSGLGDNENMAEWRDIADSDNEFADQAHHELALLLLSKDNYEEARIEMESLLESLPSDSSLRFAVLADLGYSHYLESLNTDNNEPPLEKAAEVFARLSNIKSSPTASRYNAAVRRAKCLEALGRPNIALEIYRSMISEETNSDILGTEVPLEETEWIFRAGFSAINILKENEDWAAAIKIADILSLKEGPRAFEAANLAEQLRLKHWVWD